jgi:hypothetical protein
MRRKLYNFFNRPEVAFPLMVLWIILLLVIGFKFATWKEQHPAPLIVGLGQ